MFDIDKWEEILSTMSKNKLRTVLTGFSLAWGIFMLVILLGFGKGLENGVNAEFKDDAVNSLWVYARRTAIPYKGFKEGRKIEFDNKDYQYIDERVKGTQLTTNRIQTWNAAIAYREETGSYPMRATTPEHQALENTIIIKGRFINTIDLNEERKVVVIGRLIEEEIFKGKKCLGEYLKINGTLFKIVGVFKDEGADREERYMYTPYTTMQRLKKGSDKIDMVMTTIGDANLEESIGISRDIASYLAAKHDFHPRDTRAIYIRNNVKEFTKFQNLFKNIRYFIWCIAIGTIMAGVVGISNIMAIVVKERTKEIGIRKAMGATPGSIVSLVLTEAVVITSLSGYIGLLLGVALLEFLSANVSQLQFFRNPEINLFVAISATALLIVSGVFAGFIPAKRAASIEPVIALREE